MDIFRRIQEHRDEQQQLAWRGSFKEYIDLVRLQPRIARTAHARVFDMIVEKGFGYKGEQRLINFFGEDLFGMDETLERLTEEYFHSAARRLDVRKRILLLMGPVSGGKSSIVTLLKKGLEAYTRTDSGALYGIANCPMHEEPLKLIPEALRPEVEKELGVRIEGHLCPVCQHRLQHEFNGQIEQVPVERIFLSEDNRIGIGTFSPSDPKSQDIADLTGSIDFSTIMEFGSESDPRAYRFDGELNIANRGIMEFQEILKCDEKFLWHLLSLTQEGNFKAGRFALISADLLVVAHTNETEYRSFIANKKNEALQSRMIVLPVPYNLRVSEEEKIYLKLINDSEMKHVHLAPHALRTTAMFSILTRLKESAKSGLDILKKLRVYNGEVIEGIKPTDVADLHNEFLDEGMSGIDPRYVVNRISGALIEQGRSCIQPLDILRALKEGLDQHPSLSKEDRERYLSLISLARKEYDEQSKQEVQKAFVYAFDDSAATLFENYIDNIEIACQMRLQRDPITGEELAPDERLMRAIEEQIGVFENAKQAFREEILIRISTFARQGKTFDYRNHERLKEAIEKKLFADLKDIVKITTSSKTPNAKQLKRMNDVTDRLIEQHGYCAICANELLRYVGSLLNR